MEKTEGFKRSVTKQVLLGLLTNFSSIAPSMSLGFSAVALPVLTSATNRYALNSDQASWFASIASLATPFGCLVAGPIADKFGRRRAMYCVNIFCFIGWLLIAWAYYWPQHQYVILLIGRLLTGLSTGLSSAPATIYMAEIASVNLRGVFCTWNSIAFSLGVLIVYFLGFVLQDNWGLISLITAVFPCVGMVFVTFLVPESPSWLIRKDRFDEAKTNMCKIFGTKEYIPEVAQEIDTLIRNRGVKNNPKPKTILQQVAKKLKYLTRASCLKPLSLVVGFFFFQQFAGTFVIVFYALNIVKEAGVEIDAYVAIVMIGLVRLFSAILVSYISKIFGRRPLSVVSGSGMAVCMMALAGYILAVTKSKVPEATQQSLVFLPVVLLLLYFFTSTVGFLPMPFAMAAELFPAKIRGTATGLASGIGYFFNFVTVKIYPAMISGIGREGVFFFYGAMSLAGTIYVVALLPETRGKTLQEIEEYFGKKPSKNNSLLKEPV
ncbi:facilitated trehalose transporter Tret1-2 homolog [Tribolium castaneum]|nr:PREDICTED: facilitated trehalose transporter Tret1-2 homolog [Tribolium castaneum]|eukprot:XP_973332.1 PREDICTED: facilitated trehalose transporter Tret1-2 homolog [Tribolium castaneum]